MKSQYKLILLFAVIKFVGSTAFAYTKAVDLRTCYQITPLGLDEQPTFSWRMESDKSGQSQSAYQLVLAKSESDLVDGVYIYDTGRIADNRSVCIPYRGQPLEASQRYYYKVRIWDAVGHDCGFSEVTWFETGLMDNGWDNAKWIGSNLTPFSKLRSGYIIDFDINPIDKDPATVIFGRRDSLNYNILNLTNKNLSIGHYHNGVWTEDGCENIDLSPNNAHHIRLNVFASQYCKTYRIDVEIDGVKILNTHKDPEKEPKTLLEKIQAGKQAEFEIDHGIAGSEPFYQSRLYDFFGNNNVANLKITDPAWGVLLYDSKKKVHASACPIVSKEFFLKKKIKNARLYASARGIYEAFLNGKRIGEDFLNPGWPDYRYREFYNTFDITKYLTVGLNYIESTLASGWWSDFMGYQTHWADQYGLCQSFIAKIVVEYEDGTKEIIATDESWQCGENGPLLDASLQNGEYYDARRIAVFGPCKVFGNDTEKLQAYIGSTIQAHDTIRAKTVRKVASHTYLYDFGENIAGIPSISFCANAGDSITLRYGEMLWPEIIPTNPVAPYTTEMYIQNQGNLYTDNYRSALSIDRYICKDGVQTFEPRFTQHGFRYMSIEGINRPIPLDDVKALVLHSMDNRQTCHVETSDTLLNKLIDNILRGQRGNFLAVPTDCPQRDERLGYTGDGQIFASTAMHNYMTEPFFRRWLYSVRDNQNEDGCFSDYSPKVDTPPSNVNGGGVMGWAEAGIIIPWQLYLHYADITVLKESYLSMRKYMSYLENHAENNLQPAGGLGDWLGFEETNSQITNTAFYAIDAMLMSRIAKILGEDADSKHYDNLYADIKSRFNNTFISPDGKTFTPAGYKKGKWIPKAIESDEIEDTQASYVLPLMAGLFDKPEIAISHLKDAIDRQDGHLATGFISTPYLNIVLSEHGCSDVAYDLMLTRSFPSWLYPVTQGATTIWERWNSYTIEQGFGPVNMNSFNHYAYGAVEDWIVEYMLGIKSDPICPGYKHIVLVPQFNKKLRYAKGRLDTLYGTVKSEWSYCGDRIHYHVSIPANTTATLHINEKIIELTPGIYDFDI